MGRPIGASDPVSGKVDPSNRYIPGAYTVTVGPQQIGVAAGYGNFECYHIAIQGPAGSTFQVYIGNDFYDFVPRGDINSWDPSQPMQLVSGQTVYFYWSVGTGAPIPIVQMFFRETSVL